MKKGKVSGNLRKFHSLKIMQIVGETNFHFPQVFITFNNTFRVFCAHVSLASFKNKSKQASKKKTFNFLFFQLGRCHNRNISQLSRLTPIPIKIFLLACLSSALCCVVFIFCSRVFDFKARKGKEQQQEWRTKMLACFAKLKFPLTSFSRDVK